MDPVPGGSTILIVDDDAAVRTLIRHVLEDAGYTVVGEAANGAEGVALAAELAPDLVTLDLEMPVLNGVGATERICAAGCPPIVIVSGSASSELIGRALAAGARWHVAKRDIVTQLPPVVAALLA
jgi:CheY-like chemotaxis protein